MTNKVDRTSTSFYAHRNATRHRREQCITCELQLILSCQNQLRFWAKHFLFYSLFDDSPNVFDWWKIGWNSRVISLKTWLHLFRSMPRCQDSLEPIRFSSKLCFDLWDDTARYHFLVLSWIHATFNHMHSPRIMDWHAEPKHELLRVTKGLLEVTACWRFFNLLTSVIYQLNLLLIWEMINVKL